MTADRPDPAEHASGPWAAPPVKGENTGQQGYGGRSGPRPGDPSRPAVNGYDPTRPPPPDPDAPRAPAVTTGGRHATTRPAPATSPAGHTPAPAGGPAVDEPATSVPPWAVASARQRRRRRRAAVGGERSPRTATARRGRRRAEARRSRGRIRRTTLVHRRRPAAGGRTGTTGQPVDVGDPADARAVPGRRAARRPGRAALVCLAAVVVIAALGAPLGLLWAILAPGVPIIKTADGGVFAEPSPEEFIAADGWFTLLGLGFGVLAALVGWVRAAPLPRPAGHARRGLGTVGAGWLAWQVGRADRAGRRSAGRSTPPPPGRPIAPPAGPARRRVEWLLGVVPSLRGDLLMPAFGAVVAYTLLAGWSRWPEPLRTRSGRSRRGVAQLGLGRDRQLRQRHRHRPHLAQQRRLAVEQPQLGAQPGRRCRRSASSRCRSSTVSAAVAATRCDSTVGSSGSCSPIASRVVADQRRGTAGTPPAPAARAGRPAPRRPAGSGSHSTSAVR